MRHVRRVRLEQVRPQREAFLARRRLPQPFDHLGHDARRRDVLVRLGDRPRALVRPLGEAAADAPVGREVEVREDADRLPARGGQRLEEGVVGRAAGWGSSCPACPTRCPTGSGRSGSTGTTCGVLGACDQARLKYAPLRASASSVGVSDLPGRAAVAGDAQAIGAQRVDRDDEQVALEARRRAARRGGDASAADAPPAGAPRRTPWRRRPRSSRRRRCRGILRARVDVAAPVVAVAAAETRREAVAVAVGGAARGAQQRAQAPRALRGGARIRATLRAGARPIDQAGERRHRERERQRRPEPRRQARAQRAAGRRPEPEQAVRRRRARARRRARTAARGRARASRRATAPRRTRARATAASAISRTPVAPSARGRGRARAIRRSSGSAAIAASAPGSAPIATRPAAAMVASCWLCILPTNRRWPAAATAATTTTPTRQARMPAATARSRLGSSRSDPQPGGRAPSSAAASSAAPNAASSADRAVEAEREQNDLAGRARACRQQRVQDARAHDAGQRRCARPGAGGSEAASQVRG